MFGVFSTKKSKIASLELITTMSAMLVCLLTSNVLLCGIQARDQVLHRASTSRWYYAQSSSCFGIGPWSPPSPYDKRLFIRFETVGVNTFDWKRNSFSCPSPFQSLNDLALSRADMIHATINVGHVMYLQPANFRGLHARPSFRPRLSVSHVCLAYRGLSWRHVKFAWRKT